MVVVMNKKTLFRFGAICFIGSTPVNLFCQIALTRVWQNQGPHAVFYMLLFLFSCVVWMVGVGTMVLAWLTQ